ncbi:MAG TPA: MotA/TolQ/ExbB proton channel family protein, partial [Deltaproteobacteria bacterium]|nr:MotA/TolQ/ExbB proton channel family protein [Deltaproteobacteria bacterium]
MPLLTSNAYAASAQFRGDVGAMIVDSDPIVKMVLFVLLLFSVISWGIIIQKWVVISRARKKGALVLDTLHESWSMVYLNENVNKVGDCPLSKLFRDAKDELRKVAGKNNSVSGSMLPNVENRIRSQIAQQTSDLNQGLGFLASISNSSPFIGLFGTVWGIMDA